MVEAFTGSSDPLQQLRVEGEAAARSVRDRLDQVSPGLGNPVMAVNVAVDDVAKPPRVPEYLDGFFVL